VTGTGTDDPESVARFYDATCILVPNAGHDLILEPLTAEVAEKIQEWLLGVAGGLEAPQVSD
jgi:alpha-beta hydrolase superfamily lysophospholipase